MARKKKVILLVGMQTEALTTLAGWLTAAEIKQPEVDEFGECPKLRAILEDILTDMQSHVFDEHVDTTKIPLDTMFKEALKEYFDEEFAKKPATGSFKDVLFIKDGRVNLLLDQLVKFFSTEMNAETIIMSAESNDAEQEKQLMDLCKGLYPHPKAMMRRYGACITHACLANESIQGQHYSVVDFPPDFSKHPKDLFILLKRKKTIKELPYFGEEYDSDVSEEDTEGTEGSTQTKPAEGWDDGDEEYLNSVDDEVPKEG